MRIFWEYSPKDYSVITLENFLRNEHVAVPEHFKMLEDVQDP
jgi:hypothetical protein